MRALGLGQAGGVALEDAEDGQGPLVLAALVRALATREIVRVGGAGGASASDATSRRTARRRGRID